MARKKQIEIVENVDSRDEEVLNEISKPKTKSFKIDDKKFDDNKQYFCYTRFGSIKHYGKQLNNAREDYLNQFIRFEEINK